jgi:hypothetical protein
VKKPKKNAIIRRETCRSPGKEKKKKTQLESSSSDIKGPRPIDKTIDRRRPGQALTASGEKSETGENAKMAPQIITAKSLHRK